jgi:hypothetical protein
MLRGCTCRPKAMDYPCCTIIDSQTLYHRESLRLSLPSSCTTKRTKRIITSFQPSKRSICHPTRLSAPVVSNSVLGSSSSLRSLRFVAAHTGAALLDASVASLGDVLLGTVLVLVGTVSLSPRSIKMKESSADKR